MYEKIYQSEECLSMAKFGISDESRSSLAEHTLQTPALVYEEQCILEALDRLIQLKEKLGLHVLYSIKALACPGILEIIAKHVDGFSASSLFEAILSRKILGKKGSVHIVSPAFAEKEIPEISKYTDYISFNSLSQWRRFENLDWKKMRLGLRVNPQLSFVKDERYNPCRKGSKLGIPMESLVREVNSGKINLNKISGIHFHSNCDARTLNPLLDTVVHICRKMNKLSIPLEWINLGGGYLFDEIDDWTPLTEAIDLLRKNKPLKVFIEPGEAIVGRAGSLVTTVLDIFESDGKRIAIVDSTINHFPQIFEYQYQLDVLGSEPTGEFPYLIAGRTCLAGDLFGEYCFLRPLKIGSRIIFKSAGAYSLVKANMFNGINLPSIYLEASTGKLIKLREFSYHDFWTRCGGQNEKSNKDKLRIPGIKTSKDR